MYRSQLEFLRHIQDCYFIISSTQNKSLQEITSDPVLSRAIVRNLEIIGEAAKNLDSEFTKKFPFVNWKNMAGMRDRLIHNYMEIDYEIVYDSVTNDIPELKQHLNIILEAEK